MRKTTTDLIEKIKSSEIFNFDETFNIYNICSKTIFENEDEGRAILIYILDNRKNLIHPWMICYQILLNQ